MNLRELSSILTRIHLHILEAEKAGIGEMLQRTPTPYDLLNILSSDPRFAWLKKLTQLIAFVDEVSESLETSQLREQIKIRIQEVLLQDSQNKASQSVSQPIKAPSSPTVAQKYDHLKNIKPELLDLHILLMKFMNENERKPSDSLN